MESHFLSSIFLIAALAAAGCATQPAPPQQVSGAFAVKEGRATAPFGDAVSENIVNYTRVSPNVGLAGRLTADGVREAQGHGFNLIIDLRQPTETGVDVEQAIVREIGLSYESIPLAKDKTALQQIDHIAALLEDEANYPVLIHCGSANRAGAAWALYRAQNGVPPIVAIEEGRAGGMTSREAFVREMLELAVEEKF